MPTDFEEGATENRGYHTHKSIWEATVGENLDGSRRRERNNVVDHYFVAIVKEDMVVGPMTRWCN